MVYTTEKIKRKYSLLNSHANCTEVYGLIATPLYRYILHQYGTQTHWMGRFASEKMGTVNRPSFRQLTSNAHLLFT